MAKELILGSNGTRISISRGQAMFPSVASAAITAAGQNGGGGGPPPPPPESVEVALTAHRFAAGSGATTATFGIPLKSGTLWPADLANTHLLSPSAVSTARSLSSVGPLNPDGSCSMVRVQASVGNMTRGTPVIGWKLKVEETAAPTQAFVAPTWAAPDFSQASTRRFTDGAPPGVLVPDDLNHRTTSRAIGPIGKLSDFTADGGQWAAWVQRTPVFLKGAWSTANVVPQPNNINATQTLWFAWSEIWEGNNIGGLSFDDAFLVFFHYDRGMNSYYYWLMGGGIEFLEMAMVWMYHWTMKYAQVDATIPNHAYIQVEPAYHMFLLTGNTNMRTGIINLATRARNNETGSPHNVYGGDAPPDVNGKVTGRSADARIFVRNALMMAQALAIGDNSQDWQGTLNAMYDRAWQTGSNRVYIKDNLGDAGPRGYYPSSYCYGVPGSGYGVDTFYFPLVAYYLDRAFEIAPDTARFNAFVAELPYLANYCWSRRQTDARPGGGLWIPSDFGVEYSPTFFVECGATGDTTDIGLTTWVLYAIAAGLGHSSQAPRATELFVKSSGGESGQFALALNDNDSYYYIKQSNQQGRYTPRAFARLKGKTL